MSLLLLLICGPLWAAPPLRALLVGGGPNPSHNQVAIESNIRYVYHLLPPKTIIGCRIYPLKMALHAWTPLTTSSKR
jgi:hypothetical protein